MQKRVEAIIGRVLNRYAGFLMEKDRAKLTKHLSNAMMAEFFVASYDSQDSFK